MVGFDLVVHLRTKGFVGGRTRCVELHRVIDVHHRWVGIGLEASYWIRTLGLGFSGRGGRAAAASSGRRVHGRRGFRLWLRFVTAASQNGEARSGGARGDDDAGRYTDSSAHRLSRTAGCDEPRDPGCEKALWHRGRASGGASYHDRGCSLVPSLTFVLAGDLGRILRGAGRVEGEVHYLDVVEEPTRFRRRNRKRRLPDVARLGHLDVIKIVVVLGVEVNLDGVKTALRLNGSLEKGVLVFDHALHGIVIDDGHSRYLLGWLVLRRRCRAMQGNEVRKKKCDDGGSDDETAGNESGHGK